MRRPPASPSSSSRRRVQVPSPRADPRRERAARRSRTSGRSPPEGPSRPCRGPLDEPDRRAVGAREETCAGWTRWGCSSEMATASDETFPTRAETSARQTVAAGTVPTPSTRSHGPVKGDGGEERRADVDAGSRDPGARVRHRDAGQPEEVGGEDRVARAERPAGRGGADPAAAGAAADVPEKVVRRPPPTVGTSQLTPGARIERAAPPLLAHGTTSGPVTASRSSRRRPRGRSLAGRIDHSRRSTTSEWQAGQERPSERPALPEAATTARPSARARAKSWAETGSSSSQKSASDAVVGQAQVQDVDPELPRDARAPSRRPRGRRRRSAPEQPSRAPKTLSATIEASGAIPCAPAATPATAVP